LRNSFEKREEVFRMLNLSKKVGISHTTLHRIERGEHHLTLCKLETVLGKLKIRLKDVFPDEF
jgi:transcriptional regulator with XRE-family HTH domain